MFKDKLEIHNLAIGFENSKLDLFYGNQESKKASLVPNLEKLSFVGSTNKNKIQVDPARPENNIYHLSNYVFIRDDISNNYR